MRFVGKVLLSLLATAPLTTGAFGPPAEKLCAAEHYKIVPLPLRPMRINNTSQVAGTTEAHGAAMWSERSGLRDLGTPPGFTMSEAVDINNAGHVIGFASNTSSTKRQAFRYSDGKLTLLPGVQSKPYAINDSDQIAGESTIPGKSESNPTLWKGITPSDLGACCGGAAFALNNQGKVVGNIYDREGRYHAFIWDATNQIQPIGQQDSFSSAIAINDAGHIIIDAFSRGVFLYEDGRPTRLPLAPRYTSKAAALNSCDAVVGAFGPYSDAQRAFVWDKKHGFRDLNDLVPPHSGWTLEHASSINDKGEIVGWGDHNGADDAGFLLLPEQH